MQLPSAPTLLAISLIAHTCTLLECEKPHDDRSVAEQQQDAFTRACVAISAKHPGTVRGLATSVGTDPSDCTIDPGACTCSWQFFTTQGTRKIMAAAEYDDASKNPPTTMKMVRISSGQIVDVADDQVQAGFQKGLYAFVSPDERVPIRTSDGEIRSVVAKDAENAIKLGASFALQKDWLNADLEARYQRLPLGDRIARCVASSGDVIVIKLGDDDAVQLKTP